MDDPYALVTFAIRLFNAIMWTIVFIKVIRHDRPVSRLVRRIVMTVIIFGMWVLVVGALVQFDWVAGEQARMVYTIFTAYAGLIGLGLATGPWQDT